MTHLHEMGENRVKETPLSSQVVARRSVWKGAFWGRIAIEDPLEVEGP